MKVTYARMHKTAVMVPGLGTITQSLDNQQFKNLEMSIEGTMLKVTATKDPLRVKPVTFLIPLTNLEVITIVEAPKVESAGPGAKDIPRGVDLSKGPKGVE